MPDYTAEERAAFADYETTVLRIDAEMTEAMERGAVRIRQLGTHGHNPAWRTAAAAQFRSWRRLLNALPGEPPAIYAQPHALMLRYGALLAEAGDLYARGCEEPGFNFQRAIDLMLHDVPAMREAVTVAVREAVDRANA